MRAKSSDEVQRKLSSMVRGICTKGELGVPNFPIRKLGYPSIFFLYVC